MYVLILFVAGPSRQQSMTEEPPTKIIVRNLPPSASEQFLEMYFENTRRQGGGPVTTVELYPDDNTALVEFETADGKQLFSTFIYVINEHVF